MAQITVEQYRDAERRLAAEEARRGFAIHALVTAAVSALLIIINITVADEFPWAIFPVVGMGIGLWFHWHFGVVKAKEALRTHQDAVAEHLRNN